MSDFAYRTCQIANLSGQLPNSERWLHLVRATGTWLLSRVGRCKPSRNDRIRIMRREPTSDVVGTTALPGTREVRELRGGEGSMRQAAAKQVADLRAPRP
jgi:hypothetical protein